MNPTVVAFGAGVALFPVLAILVLLVLLLREHGYSSLKEDEDHPWHSYERDEPDVVVMTDLQFTELVDAGLMEEYKNEDNGQYDGEEDYSRCTCDECKDRRAYMKNIDIEAEEEEASNAEIFPTHKYAWWEGEDEAIGPSEKAHE